jgi:hypothetical protein
MPGCLLFLAMTALSCDKMLERKLKIKAANTPPDGLATDAIIHWGASIQANKLLKFREWHRQGQPTPGYNAFKPTYVFAPRLEEGESKSSIVNMSLERCFGTRSDANWAIWIQGFLIRKSMARTGRRTAELPRSVPGRVCDSSW